jgi:hypothetical protein
VPLKANRSGRAMWPFEGLSLPAATAWADAASVLLLVCVLAGLAAVFVFIRATNVKEHYLSKAKDEYNLKVKTLEGELEKAKTAAADADGRALEAQTQLAKAKTSPALTGEQSPASDMRTPEPQAQLQPKPQLQAQPQLPPQAQSATPKVSRSLTSEQVQSLTQRMATFKGQHVTIGASPVTAEAGSFADQLVLALKTAGVSADRNDASAGIQIGAARGVVARHVTGNDRGEQFAKSLTEELSADGIAAKTMGGLVEEIMKELVKLGRAINDPANEWVVIAVGDRGS